MKQLQEKEEERKKMLEKRAQFIEDSKKKLKFDPAELKAQERAASRGRKVRPYLHEEPTLKCRVCLKQHPTDINLSCTKTVWITLKTVTEIL